MPEAGVAVFGCSGSGPIVSFLQRFARLNPAIIALGRALPLVHGRNLADPAWR